MLLLLACATHPSPGGDSQVADTATSKDSVEPGDSGGADSVDTADSAVDSDTAVDSDSGGDSDSVGEPIYETGTWAVALTGTWSAPGGVLTDFSMVQTATRLATGIEECDVPITRTSDPVPADCPACDWSYSFQVAVQPATGTNCDAFDFPRLLSLVGIEDGGEVSIGFSAAYTYVYAHYDWYYRYYYDTNVVWTYLRPYGWIELAYTNTEFGVYNTGGDGEYGYFDTPVTRLVLE